MAKLVEDAIQAANWVATALQSSGYKADFSIQSLKEIDRLFDEHSFEGNPKSGGLLASQTGSRLFALGAYVGECVRRTHGGNWRGDDNDPTGEINIALVLPDGGIIWPIQRIMKRLKNGSVENVYEYGLAMNHLTI